MPIPVSCSNCEAVFRVRDEHAGKKGRCPRCKAPIEVPGPAPESLPGPAAEPPPPPTPAGPPPESSPTRPESPPQPSYAELRREILAGFQGRIDPVRVPFTYRLGLPVVAVVMVVLPLIYVGLIGLLLCGMYLHAVHDVGILGEGGSGRGSLGVLLVYLTPLVVGAILVLFMIKPLFARPAEPHVPRSLLRQDEPLLFEHVERLCSVVNAPVPSRIDVDCQVNASASFRRGMRSVLTGGDLVLTIGLPLAAGLSLQQLTGVLAHEFGHFSQGAGMRLTYVIRSVSFWFTRVVYERDVWDQRLIDWSKGTDWRIAIVLYLARFCVWITRKILWVLMMVGHIVASYMLRQMEFDADRYEARVAGSGMFEPTVRTLARLSLSTDRAHGLLGESHREGRLADNVPRMILSTSKTMPREVSAEIDRMILHSKTGFLDTHPSDRDRIASARRENAPGVFGSARPATALFRDFESLSRTVSIDFYRAVLGKEFREGSLRSTYELMARHEREQEAGKALDRYLQCPFFVLRPLPLSEEMLRPPENPGQAFETLKRAREKLCREAPGYDKVTDHYDKLDTQTLEIDQAVALLEAGFRIEPGTFSIQMGSLGEAADLRSVTSHRLESILGRMAAYEGALATRLDAGLRLLHAEQVAARVPDADALREESRRLIASGRRIHERHAGWMRLRNAHATVALLFDNLESNEENERLINRIRAGLETLEGLIRDWRADLDQVPYPFDHAGGGIGVGAFLLNRLPEHENPAEIMEGGMEMLDGMVGLRYRIAARLAVIAESVETALGLPLLPETEPREKMQEEQA